MSSTKPVQSAPASPAPRAAAHAHVPHAFHGLQFANVLAQAGVPAPRPPIAPQAPKGAVQTALPQAVLAVHGEPEKRTRHHGHGSDELDPVARQAAQLAPPATMTPVAVEREATAAQTHARVSLEELVPQLVKKIAWSGDAQRGTVRMELGAGDLAGGTLTVSAENGRVSVHVAAPPGTDANAWKNRIATRLEARGIAVDTVHVE